MIYLAIDPGVNGAIAINDPRGTVAYRCPDSQKDIVDLLKNIKSSYNDIYAIIEKVHSMPGQGVKSVWTFASNYATWQTALIALDIPFTEVLPRRWMNVVGVLPKDKAERKREIKSKMQKMFPGLKVTLINADALAILTACPQLVPAIL